MGLHFCIYGKVGYVIGINHIALVTIKALIEKLCHKILVEFFMLRRVYAHKQFLHGGLKSHYLLNIGFVVKVSLRNRLVGS